VDHTACMSLYIGISLQAAHILSTIRYIRSMFRVKHLIRLRFLLHLGHLRSRFNYWIMFHCIDVDVECSSIFYSKFKLDIYILCSWCGIHAVISCISFSRSFSNRKSDIKLLLRSPSSDWLFRWLFC